MIERLHYMGGNSEWLEFNVEPCVSEGTRRYIQSALDKQGISFGHWYQPDYRTLRITFDEQLTEDQAHGLILGELSGEHEIKLTLEEAGRELSRQLYKYAGQEGWYFIGVSDTEMFIYTKTRKRANELLSFIGYEFEGYKVRGKMVGKIKPLAKPCY